MFRGKRWYRGTLKVGNTPSEKVLARVKEAAKYLVAFDGKDEILFAACLHSEEPGSHLRTRIWNRLAATICDIIAWGTETDAMTPEERTSSPPKLKYAVSRKIVAHSLRLFGL